MIARWEAMLIAGAWLYQGARPGETPAVGVSEFDLGFVLWRIPADGGRGAFGAGKVVVDRHSGELTDWPSLPAEVVAERYRAYRQRTPVAPLTWDPLVQARHDRLRAPFPQQVTQVRLVDGRLRTARGMKGDGTPDLHPLVGEALDEVPAERRVRGDDRCSEVAAFSDLLHAEDARRSAAGEPVVTLAEARSELLAAADLVTYQVREPDDPLNGQSAPPCISCQVWLRRFGFAPAPIAPVRP